MNVYSVSLKTMTKELVRLSDDLAELEVIMDKEAEALRRLEQVKTIKAIGLKLAREIKRVQEEESESEDSFNTAKSYSSVVSLATGSIMGAFLRHKNPILFGVKLANKELSKKSSFGTVLIAIRENGKIEDIEAISVSSIARELHTTELDARSSLRRQGFTLLSTEKFYKILNLLEREILNSKYEPDLNKRLINFAQRRHIN